jgi:hypothetical protein
MITTLVVALGAVLLPTVANADDDGVREYSVDLSQLNDSGVSGTVSLTLEDGRFLTVIVQASGLEPNRPHPQHIHGFRAPKQNASCPTQEADEDGNGIIDLAEGIPFFGPVIIALEPFNLVDGQGNLYYEEAFVVNPGEVQPLHKRAVVLHGLTVNGEYVASLPVACGEIEAVD